MEEALICLLVFKPKATWKKKKKPTNATLFLILDPLRNFVSSQKITVLQPGCGRAGPSVGMAVTSSHVLSATGSS